MSKTIKQDGNQQTAKIVPNADIPATVSRTIGKSSRFGLSTAMALITAAFCLLNFSGCHAFPGKNKWTGPFEPFKEHSIVGEQVRDYLLERTYITWIWTGKNNDCSDDPDSYGTAAAISPDGYLLTCAHVAHVDNPNATIRVTPMNFRTRPDHYPTLCRTVFYDKANDWAILKLETGDTSSRANQVQLPLSRWFPLCKARPKQDGLLFSLGTASHLAEYGCCTGKIIALGHDSQSPKGKAAGYAFCQDNSSEASGHEDQKTALQFSATLPFQKGDSGSPMIDPSGALLGIFHSIMLQSRIPLLSPQDHTSFATWIDPQVVLKIVDADRLRNAAFELAGIGTP